MSKYSGKVKGSKLTYGTNSGIYYLSDALEETEVKYILEPVEVKWYASFNDDTQSLKTIYEAAFKEWLDALKAANVIELRAFFGNSNTPSYVITDSTYIAGLKTALTNGNPYGDGTSTSWYMGWGCGSPSTTTAYTSGSSSNPSFHFGQAVACTCDSFPTIRPLIGNKNWGGVGGGCSQGPQSMGMSFLKT